jgi:hypothetical protein
MPGAQAVIRWLAIVVLLIGALYLAAQVARLDAERRVLEQRLADCRKGPKSAALRECLTEWDACALYVEKQGGELLACQEKTR